VRALGPRPFDFAALEQAAAVDGASSLARVLGVDRRYVYRFRQSGLHADQADELAVRAGFHPAELWPTW
jgi:hypothetical protein